jgi:REP element-mobilizing transposase RayT
LELSRALKTLLCARLPEPDGGREQRARNEMTQEPYVLDVRRRDVVLRSLQEVCSRRGWTLLAAHVRINHVHVVATAACKPESVLNALKVYSSRALTHLALDSPNRRRWARHGSTRYLWTSAAVSAAIQYVVREQGDLMAVFEMPAAR